jgi:hypothetical protein
MTWAPLIVVSIPILWLRFKMAERIVERAEYLIAFTLQEHGTKRLFNGAPSRPLYQAPMNRKARRARRWEMLHRG